MKLKNSSSQITWSYRHYLNNKSAKYDMEWSVGGEAILRRTRNCTLERNWNEQPQSSSVFLTLLNVSPDFKQEVVFFIFFLILACIMQFAQNACTLVPTVFRWNKKNGIQISFLFFVFLRPCKMEFHSHFYFSFFVYLWHWKTDLIFVSRFSFFVFAALWKGDLNFSFCFSFSHHFQKRIWISFFVFRFLITLKNGFAFRFSYMHCLLLTNRLEFCLSFLHEFEKWINTPVIWNSPLPPYLRGWPG